MRSENLPSRPSTRTHQADIDISHATTSLFTTVRHKDVNRDTRKETRFEKTKEDSDADKLAIVFGESCGDSDGSPNQTRHGNWLFSATARLGAYMKLTHDSWRYNLEQVGPHGLEHDIASQSVSKGSRVITGQLTWRRRQRHKLQTG